MKLILLRGDSARGLIKKGKSIKRASRRSLIAFLGGLALLAALLATGVFPMISTVIAIIGVAAMIYGLAAGVMVVLNGRTTDHRNERRKPAWRRGARILLVSNTRAVSPCAAVQPLGAAVPRARTAFARVAKAVDWLMGRLVPWAPRPRRPSECQGDQANNEAQDRTASPPYRSSTITA